MKILVIGKNGQIGSALLRAAALRKIATYGVSKEELNIKNKKSIEKIVKKIKPTIIINTSAFHVVADCESQPEKAFIVNSAAVKHLADVCAENKIRLVHFSTDKVFDGDRKAPYSEGDCPNPLQIYGISKLAGEECALYYNPDTLIIRTCGVFGGKFGSRSKKGNFVLYILKEGETKTTLEISSEQVVSVAYAEDLALAIVKLIQKKAEKGIYNVVNTGACSWADFASEIVKKSNTTLKIIGVDRKGVINGKKIPKYTALSTRKINSLGIELPSWKDGLERYMKFLGK
jgi:dTDP-4-dehydrorhamnose reductase